MALPNGAGGYQLGDGNTSEPLASPVAITAFTGATVALTTASLAGGLVTLNGGTAGAVTATTPTAAAIDAAFPSLRTGSSFLFRVCNISTVAAEDATLAGGTGVTIVGKAVVNSNDGATDSGATFLAYKSGDAAYSFYRVS